MTDNNQIVAYAPGVYDLFHIGHLNLLRNAKERCHVLIAGVVDDSLALRAKGISPTVPFDERFEIVQAIRYVDKAVVEDTNTKIEMWERYHFNAIVKGDDWKGTEKGNRLEAEFAPYGVAVIYVPYTQHTSSTVLRRVLARISETEHDTKTTG